MAGIDVLFASLRRENHTELLPQLLQLKTVHRTVFFTPQPKGSIPALQNDKGHPVGCPLSLVEMAGIEPASELPSIKLSTSVFSLLRFPRV